MCLNEGLFEDGSYVRLRVVSVAVNEDILHKDALVATVISRQSDEETDKPIIGVVERSDHFCEMFASFVALVVSV